MREKGVTTKWHFQGVNLLYNLLPEVGGWPGINAIVRFKFFFQLFHEFMTNVRICRIRVSDV